MERPFTPKGDVGGEVGGLNLEVVFGHEQRWLKCGAWAFEDLDDFRVAPFAGDFETRCARSGFAARLGAPSLSDPKNPSSIIAARIGALPRAILKRKSRTCFQMRLEI
jgi:hypothetical protein